MNEPRLDASRSAACLSAAALLLCTFTACSQPAKTTRQSQPTEPVPPAAPQQEPSPQPQEPPAPQAREVFPGVRLNTAARTVEFDAIIPINAQDPDKPRIYLEVIACTRDTKEHEAVLMTTVRPSHVHAALLLLGLESGSPGVWDWSGEQLVATPPAGPRVEISCTYTHEGTTRTVNPAEWVLDVNTGRTLAQSAGEHHWVFAGSQVYKRQGRDYYRADVDGTLIGLHTFGGESIAWTQMFNPDSQVEEPHWIANKDALPPYGTAVTVTITAQ
jgi:hypothetical protein